MKFQFMLLVTVVLLIITSTSNADMYTYEFTAVVINGTYAGETGMGTFTYDTDYFDSATIRAGTGGLTVTLDLFGQTFTEVNDVGYNNNGAPSVFQFDDQTTLKNPSMLDFAVSEGCVSGVDCGDDRVITPIDREGVIGFEGMELIFNSDENRYYWDVHVIEYEPDPVPEPATLFLLGAGLIGLIGRVRRK